MNIKLTNPVSKKGLKISKGDFVEMIPFANMVKVSKRFSSRILIARFLNYNLKNL